MFLLGACYQDPRLDVLDAPNGIVDRCERLGRVLQNRSSIVEAALPPQRNRMVSRGSGLARIGGKAVRARCPREKRVGDVVSRLFIGDAGLELVRERGA